MKQLCLLIVTCAVLTSVSVSYSQTIVGPHPTLNLVQTNWYSRNAGWAIGETSDLRLLHCDPETLKQRISRSVVTFDIAGIIERRGARSLDSEEVRIEGSITMKQFLMKVGLENWSGGQPQVKLIKRNMIIQSPVSEAKGRATDLPLFLDTQVSAGDFVIVCKRI